MGKSKTRVRASKVVTQEVEVVNPAVKDLEDSTFLKLISLAPSERVRDVLAMYVDADNLASLSKSYTSKVRKDVLVETLNYLGCGEIECQDGRVYSASSFTLQVAAQLLVNRLCEFAPEICGHCKAPHAPSLEEKAILCCYSCRKPAHNECIRHILQLPIDQHPTPEMVQAMINPLNLPGLHYMCVFCSSETEYTPPSPMTTAKPITTPAAAHQVPPPPVTAENEALPAHVVEELNNTMVENESAPAAPADAVSDDVLPAHVVEDLNNTMVIPGDEPQGGPGGTAAGSISQTSHNSSDHSD